MHLADIININYDKHQRKSFHLHIVLGMSFKNESLEGGSVFTLFRFPSIRFMTMVAFYTWLVVGVGYYALTISASGPSRLEN